MLCPEARASTLRCADHQRHFELPTAHVAILRHLVVDLIHAHQREIDKHEFDYGTKSSKRRAQARPDDSRFGDWRIPHAVWPELVIQTRRHLEHAARYGDIFSEEDHVLVAAHFVGQCHANSITISCIGHKSFLATLIRRKYLRKALPAAGRVRLWPMPPRPRRCAVCPVSFSPPARR